MPVLYDAGSEYQRSASAATVSLTHTGTVANVVGVAVAFVKGGATQPTISAVSYGGVTLLQVIRSTDTAGEAGAAEWWFAGTGVPSGVRVVSYNTTAIASNVHVVINTFTGQYPTFVVGSKGISEDTANPNSSVTTGYVPSLVMAAIYSGGAGSSSCTFSADCTQIHDWDFGAFYSRVVRKTSTTAAGAGPVNIGFTTGGSDDVAFVALAISDGAISAALGGVTVTGLAPTLAGERVVTPGVGAVATGGQIAVVTGVVTPDVGSIRGQSWITGPVIYSAPAALNTHEPVVSGYTFPAVGTSSAVGQLPTVADISEGPSTTVLPDVGLVNLGGQVPDEFRELSQAVGVGLISAGGQVPTALPEGAIGPTQGQAAIAGLAPDLATELVQGVEVGGAVIVGLLPTVSDGTVTTVEATALPDVGLVTLGGAEPTLAVEYDKPRGHVQAKRRRGLYEVPEDSDTPTVAVAIAVPDVSAYWTPPADAIAGMDTSGVEATVSMLEAEDERRRKRRREEEDFIMLWLRAA